MGGGWALNPKPETLTANPCRFSLREACFSRWSGLQAGCGSIHSFLMFLGVIGFRRFMRFTQLTWYIRGVIGLQSITRSREL